MAKLNTTFQHGHRFLLVISLIIGCCAVSLAGVAAVRFDSGKSALHIPLRIVGNHIYAQVSVNDAKPLWFLLDTGAGNIINRKNALALGLKPNQTRQMRGVGEGVADYFLSENVSFTLPGVKIAGETFAVVSLENVEECAKQIDVDWEGNLSWRAQPVTGDEAELIDGVLGYEFFKLFVVELDYAAKSLNLYDPKSYQYQGKGERIPLELRQRHIYIRAPITASGHAPVDGLFMIDSGSAVAVILNSPFVAQTRLLPPPGETTPFKICGIGGESQTQIGKLAGIRLGNIKLPGPVTMFSQAVNGALANPETSGSIGNAILRRFKVVFDYSRLLMILEQK